ncbi:hypothetical protein HPP92_025842 [Vanilla planifolia]|uniref:non-specific serine/threonine protein kinase n=1 Tax=Vanilla planifolia TaxID=51239 RepID=A0A835PGR1_VANPL|nr:hypothetical protein HPP92_025842 [Vanilla planifolia]
MSESESTASPESSSHVNESSSDSSSPSPDTSSFRSPSGESNSSSPPSPQSSDSSSSSLPGNSDSSSSSSSSSSKAPPESSSESDSYSDGASSSSGPSSETKSSPDPENSSTSESSSGSSSTSPKKHNEPPSSDDNIRAENGKSPPRSSHSSTESPVVPSSSFPNDMPAPSKPVLSNSSSATNHSDSGGTSTGAIISLALVGVVITLIAVFIVITRRKKRRDSLIDRYKEPGSFPVKSDNYYYRSENPTGHSGLSDSYGAPQRLSNASGSTFGSQRDYGHFSGSEPGGKSWFRHEELMDITDGFSQQNLIGEGGFGCVYKGALSDGRQVAVKQLKAGGGQGDREFRAEVEVISRVHHRHLVSLVGYCITGFDRLLVYEFVPNNTLEHHLHGKGVSVMEWSKRLKIAFGAAKGLAYLHEDCHPRIIHRDIKSANILVDNDWEAKACNAYFVKYLAPEYALSGKLTDRSDVFSFGVVLLELITGRKPVDTSRPMGDESLVEWARPLLVHALESGNLDELVDSRLEKNYLKNEMFRMVEAAAACIRHSAPKRPRMVQVMRALDSDGDMGDLSNGVKFGQSQVYESGQYSADIRRFRRMALGTEDFNSDYGFSSEYGGRRSSAQSGEYRGRDRQSGDPSNSWHSGESSSEYSGDSETRAMFPRPRESREIGSYRYGS